MRWWAAGVLALVALLAAPAVAQDAKPERVVPRPKSGGTATTFVVRYDSGGPEAFSGDALHVRGPRGTRCEGEVLFASVGHESGIQTIRMGPRLRDDDGSGRTYHFVPRDPDTQRRLPDWCRGVYRGWIAWEGEDLDSETHTRFRFAVR